MVFPGTNLEGVIAFMGGFGLAIAAGKFAEVDNEAALTVVGGGFVTAIDWTLRLRPEPAGAVEPRSGPKILFLPAWWFGLFWIGLGVCNFVMR